MSSETRLFWNSSSPSWSRDQVLLNLFLNMSNKLDKLQKSSDSNTHYEDNSNAWMYILFVLTFYAFSIIVLLVKYIRREREGSKLDFYYNEFVKRDWYEVKSLYDNSGRRVRYQLQDSVEPPDLDLPIQMTDQDLEMSSICDEYAQVDADIHFPDQDNDGAASTFSTIPIRDAGLLKDDLS